MKKALSVILCAVLVLCLSSAIFAFADDPVTAEITLDLPSEKTVKAGETVALSISIDKSESAVSVQWYRNGQLLENNSLSYVFTAGDSDNHATYSVRLTDNETGAPIASNACTLTVTSAAEPSAAPSAAPTQAPAEEEEEDGELVITKSPTGESKKAGESATFISNADNYTSLEWRIVTADGSACWRNQAEITGKFGVGYNAYKGDDGREYLILSNLPANMNGYYIQTKFYDADGNAVFTDKALINVSGGTPATPAPTPTPAARPTPTPAPTPGALITPLPAAIPASPALTPAVSPSPTVTPVIATSDPTGNEPAVTEGGIITPSSARNDRIGFISILVAALAGTGVIASAAVLINSRRAEKKAARKNKLDLPDKFYEDD